MIKVWLNPEWKCHGGGRQQKRTYQRTAQIIINRLGFNLPEPSLCGHFLTVSAGLRVGRLMAGTFFLS
ncbi:hypothetical protein LBMAG15_00090 [Actinomycetes bacterium]|nr:hypothetical protein LBMAG15_00090 [Actinomycetes bacterium]